MLRPCRPVDGRQDRAHVFATPSPRLIPEGEKRDTFTRLALAPDEGRTLKGAHLAIVRRLRRPDFENWSSGFWLNPDPLPMELKQRLWDLFPARWEWVEKTDVLYLVGEGVQSAQAFFEETASADRVAQLQRIQDRARELLKALAALRPETAQALDAHIAYLMLGNDTPEQLSGFTESARREHETLSRWWDVVQDVEVATAYAVTQESPSKTDRPAIRNAKRLTYFAADAVYSVRGFLPPRGKGTWFPEFARELGSGFGLTCGPALVDSVVSMMGGDGRYQKKAPAAVPTHRRALFVAPVPPPV